MIKAAEGALKSIFSPTPNDIALILTDEYSSSIATAFKTALENLGCKVDIYTIDNKYRPLKDVPPELELLLPGKKIVLNILRAYSEEIPFRIKWIFKVEENKQIKMGHMPGITEEMMYGAVNVDFSLMMQTAERIKSMMKNAETLHITTEEGTNILLGVKNRIFSSDVGIKEGEMCNLPCGEVYCAPLEDTANGVLVFNASIGDIGLLKHPLRVFVAEGKITKFESDDPELVKKITELTEVDDDAKIIGELGIGINPGAKITGNMLEDEKALGTAHIAFGNNEDFPGGGKNRSEIHRDYLFYRPNINVKYTNGETKTVLLSGVILH